MKIKVRAVIWEQGRLVVSAERRQGREHISLPGGRVHEREEAAHALVREVREETGVDVTVGPLVYAVEVVSAYGLHDLNLIFAATVAAGQSVDGLTLVDVRASERDLVYPPILATIAADLATGWPPPARWLGNVYAAGPR